MEKYAVKTKWFKRSLAIVLAVLMCISTVSVFSAFAADDKTPQQQLEDILDEIYALNADDYTEDSYNELKEQADSVVRPVTPYDEATGDGMPDWVANIMIKNLTEAMNNLVKITPQSRLEDLLDEIYALNSDDYTAESYNELKEQADSVVRPVTPYDEATGDGMPDWVANYMITTLTDLMDKLQPADKKTVFDKLEDKLKEAEALNSSDYTEESWAKVKEIIDSIDRPVSSENITEKLATKMLSDLEKAIEALEQKPDESIKLEDGTYYAKLTHNSSNFKDRAKIVAKDGKYKVTIYTKTSTSQNFDGDYKSNRLYTVYSRSDHSFKEVEVVKPENNDRFENIASKYSKKNLVSGFDIADTDYKDEVKEAVSSDYDDLFFDSSYVVLSDYSVATTFETDELDSTFLVNGLFTLPYYKYGGDIERMNYCQLSDNIKFNSSDIVKIADDFTSLSGTYVKTESASNSNKNERNISKQPFAKLESKNGKVYVTYSFDPKARAQTITDAQSTEAVYDAKGNKLDTSNNEITLEYSSYDELISGTYVKSDVSIVSSSRGAYNRMYESDFAVDFTAKPVTITDSATGIKLYSTSKFISENAKLNVSLVKDTGSTDTDKDAWANAMSKLPKYNKMYFFNFNVTDGGNEVTDFGGAVSIEVPKVDGLNESAVRLFLNKYFTDYKSFAFGWFNEYIVVNNDGYAMVLDPDYFDGNWCIYDEKMSNSDGSSLSDGTYRVPITTFNQIQPDQTSMSAQCLGDYATLVVKNGVKRLELEYKPVDIGEMQGYLIQMWEQEKDGEYKELTYTSYYKNEDGSYYTDALNEGTNNYYPKTGYMILPTDDVQFLTKFRVSAMDAIMGDNGDATREAIFTIYYDDAEKISDETPDAAPEEIPNFKPADTANLKELVAQAKELKESGYTTSTYTTMINALSNANVVLANTKATQEEVDNAYNELKNAISALVKVDDGKLDVKNLPDGKYTLYAQMIKTDRQSFSMSNNAIKHDVWLEVKNGEYYLTMQFKGMSIYNKFGYLLNLSYFDSGYTYNEYGVPQGALIPATVLSTQKDSGGNDIIDQYNDANNLYPNLVRFKLVDKADEKYVPLQVFVPIMESIADETGTQPVLMQLDWTTLKKDNGDIQPDKPVEQSPAVDLTNAATGVKLAADKGVFKEGVQLSVSEIANGADFDLASKALDGIASKFNLYNVNFLDKAGSDVEPNGTVTLSFPVSKDYNSANIALYRINADGTKTVVKGTYADGLYTVVTKAGGSYAVADTTKQEEPTKPTEEPTQPTEPQPTTPSQDNTQPTTQAPNNSNAGSNTNNTQNTTADNNTSNNTSSEGKVGTVKTGDTSSAMIYFAVMLSACAVLAVVSVKRKGKN